MVSILGEGGQAKVFKAKFHDKDVAMKYIPLDKAVNPWRDGYEYDIHDYGCDEYYQQEKFPLITKVQPNFIVNCEIDREF